MVKQLKAAMLKVSPRLRATHEQPFQRKRDHYGSGKNAVPWHQYQKMVQSEPCLRT